MGTAWPVGAADGATLASLTLGFVRVSTPACVTALEVACCTHTAALLRWRPPPASSDADLRYTIVALDGENTKRVLVESTAETNAEVGPLEAGARHQLEVRAMNLAGPGSPLRIEFWTKGMPL